MVSEFADARSRVAPEATIVYVYQGTAEQGPMFFAGLDPDATAIADPDGELYRAFEVERGGWREMFGLRSWLAGLRATRKGHLINRKIGDAWTLPTVLVVHDGQLLGAFRGEHAGDHPDVERLLATVEEMALDESIEDELTVEETA